MAIRTPLPQFGDEYDGRKLRVLVENLDKSFRTINNALLVPRTRNVTATTTTPYTISSTEDHIDMDATAGAKIVKLPASPVTGREVSVAKTDAGGNAVTVNGNGKNINGAGTSVLSAQYDSEVYLYTGTEWRKRVN